MNTQYPKIIKFETRKCFSYLWLKYITGFNLDEHCARCLLGEYSSLFPYGKVVKKINDKELNEHDAKYYYLCGVSKPYKWIENLHIAFKYKAGAMIDYDDGKTRVLIQDAEQIEIKEQPVYRARYGDYAAYNTCRNWRFAYQIINNCP